MKRICATLGGQRFEIPWEGPALLSDLLAPHGFSLPCGGAHTCGACRVTAYGELSPLSAEEKRLLTTEEQLSDVYKRQPQNQIENSHYKRQEK